MIDPVPPTSRNPWVGAWIAAHRARRRWYSKRAKHLPRPVISVGNLHWGGTGKTPIVAALARHLSTPACRVCILSRGYGRQSRGPLVVSQGKGPIVDVQAAGDEPFVHALELPDVDVVVAEDRFEGGRVALEQLATPPSLFILDDAFSHLSLYRDLDLLVLPAADPWGGGQLPPGGRLREPLEASARADAILLSGSAASADLAAQIPRELAPFGFRGPAFSSTTRPGPVLTAAEEPISKNTPLLLVTGIARGHRVLESARSHDLRIVDHLEFPDHYSYPTRGLERIRRRLVSSGAEWVLTTAKDRAKLQGHLVPEPLVLPLHTRIEESFYPWIEGNLASLSVPLNSGDTR